MLVFAIAGCSIVETGDHVWYKEGAASGEREGALAAAQMQAKQAHVQPAGERDIVVRSMTAQGWRLVDKRLAPTPKAKPKTQPPPPFSTTLP